MAIMETVRNHSKTVNEIDAIEISKWIRETTKQHLENVVDNEVEKLKDITQRTWKIDARNIVKHIKESPQMTSLVNIVNTKFDMHATNFVSDVDKQLCFLGTSSTCKAMLRTQSQSIECVDIENIEVDMNNPKHLLQLTEATSHYKPYKTRIKALNILLNIQLCDAVSSECWPQLQQNLQEGLCDQDKEVFYLCLKIHAKLTSTSSPHFVIKEGFLSIIEGLRSHYSRKFHQLLPNFEQGVDMNNAIHLRILQISHLLLHTVNQMSMNWIRYGERLVDEIVDAFLALLTMHTYDSMYSKNFLYPFHVLAFFDPEAMWCAGWFHESFGCNACFSKQTRILALLRYIVEEIYLYLNLPPTKTSTNRYSSESIKSATFNHCVNILGIISSHHSGHKFFPLKSKIQDKPLTLQEIFNIFISHLNNLSKETLSSKEENIIGAIIKVLNIDDSPLLNDYTFVKVLLEPLQSITEDHYDIPSHTLKILDRLCDSVWGKYHLLGVGAQQKEIMQSIIASLSEQQAAQQQRVQEPLPPAEEFCPAQIIVCCTATLLKCRHVDTESLRLLIEICTKLYQYHNTFLILDAFDVPLIPMAVRMYKQLCSQCCADLYPSEAGPADPQSQVVLSVLTRFLAGVGNSPLGLLALAQHDSLVSDLVRSLLRVPSVPWCDPEMRRLVVLLTALPEGATALAEESGKAIARVLCNLWATHEDQESFVKDIGTARENADREFLNIVFAASCTLAGAEALLTEHEGSEDTLLECGPSPTTVADLLAFNNSVEPWHYIGLLVLRALAANLDTWLYLESTLHIQKELLQLQADNVATPYWEEGARSSNKDIIIDECSMLRHQILMSTCVIGGPSEHTIPSLDIDFDSLDDDVGPQLFYELPIPPARSPGIQAIRSKVNTELQRLLHETRGGLRDANWLVRARRAFRATCQEPIKAGVLLDLVEQVARCSPIHYCILDWPANGVIDTTPLCYEELLGVEAAVRYGTQGHLLQACSPNVGNLQQFLQLTQAALQYNRNTPKFRGFDWFAASVFLLCGGNIDRCCSFLNHFAALPTAMVLWPLLAESRGVSNFIFTFSHLLESIIAIELPISHGALKMAGVPWGLVSFTWLAQSFWNVLDWSQLCQWLALCILHPPDMALYFCIALLRHLQPRIIEAAPQERVWEQIKLTPVVGFRVGDNVVYMEKLVRRHRSKILPRLLESIAITETYRLRT